jgi:hypothetical protein
MGNVSEPTGFVRRIFSENCKRSVLIEDNGRVGYAYLLDADGHICSDVWLYNRCLAPTEPEWVDREKAPFANPAPYVNQKEEFPPPTSADDFSIEWECQCDHCVANVFVRMKLIAKLENGTKPGWAALATTDGPLAKVLR